MIIYNRVRAQQAFKGFGSVGPGGATCPIGDVNSWCDCMYPASGDPESSESSLNNMKCKSQPLGFLTPKPWTDAGAMLLGIPHDYSGTLSTIGKIASSMVSKPGTGTGQPQATAQSGGLFHEGSKTLLLLGGATLLVGVGAVMLKRKPSKKGRR